MKMNKSVKDIAGKTFGRITVISFAGSEKGNSNWLCRCKCGVEKVIQRCSLVSGATQSCGCLSLEISRVVNVVHGETSNGKSSPEYHAWEHMKSRCFNPNCKEYKWYGSRGITVCERWMDFPNFLTDMGRKPLPDLSIERINNDGNYEPGNCKWGTTDEQRNNQRNNRKIEIGGVTANLFQWLSQYQVKKGAYYSRINRGWDVERAITQPICHS